MKDMFSSETFKTYAVVVIESLWPSREDYRGEGENIVFSSGAKNYELLKFSPLQSKYSGYYKIIPLNILSVNTSFSKEGGNFNISFTANNLLFLSDRELPDRIKKILESTSTRLENFPIDQFPFLEKVLVGNDKLRVGYITNYNVISQFIRELDTVSIYLVNIKENLSNDLLPLYIGKNPGRTKQAEAAQLADKKNKILVSLGISKNELKFVDDVLKSKDLKNMLFYYRKFSYPLIINRFFKALNIHLFSLNSEFRNKIYQQELNNAETEDIENFINLFGRTIFEYYFKDRNARKQIKSCIESYYKANSVLSKLISWTAFETLRLKLNESLGVSPGLCFSRNSKVEEERKFKTILNAIVIDNFLYEYANKVLGSESQEELEFGINFINNILGNNLFSLEDYLLGIHSLLSIFVKDFYNTESNTEEIEISDIQEELTINNSGDALSLVFRGHITDISRSVSINENSSDITISIKGRDFSHPLRNHEVYADYTSIKFAAQPLENYSVKILTPVEAVLKIMNSFAPQKINILELDRETFLTSVISSRGFDTFYNAGTQNILINQGNVVAPSYDAQFDELSIFTPIHYISLDFIQMVKNAFDTEGILQKFLANVNVDISDGPLFDVLKRVISSNSAYRIYVDHLGYLKIEYEPAHISFPFSLSLNREIDDYYTFSIEHSSSESNITTFVEVIPKSFGTSSPSSMGIASLYGRSIPPTIQELYSTIEYIDSNKDKFVEFLSEAVKLLDNKLKDHLIQREGEYEKEVFNELNKLNTFINQQNNNDLFSALRGLTKKESVSQQISSIDIVTETTYREDFCTGEKIPNTSYTIQESTKTIQTQVEVPINLFKPEVLSNIFNVGRIDEKFFYTNVDHEYYKLFAKSFATLNEYYVNKIALLNDICPKLNAIARTKFKLSSSANVCFEENLDVLSSLMVLGAKFELYGKTDRENATLGNLITNIINSIRIKSSENIFKINLSKVDENKNQTISYLKDFYAYFIPFSDISNVVKNENNILKNLSPDLFIYGLRRKTFSDAFISVVDSLRNEERISAKRAEIIRKLNSKPINTAKVSVLGHNYFVGYTTLLINEKLPPLNDAFISQKTLNDINDDAKFVKDKENLIIYINEKVLTKRFSEIYNKLLPQIPGYNPPSKVDEETIINYFTEGIKFILSFNYDYVPYQYWVPLWGVYTKESLENINLGDYVKILLTELLYHVPEKQQDSSEYSELLFRFISNNQQYMHIYQEYVKPQNYLVAQGHIENVEHSWSLGSVYTTNVGLNYLLPAIYTYLPLGKKKIIIGYVVIDSPLSKFNESGQYNKFLKDEEFFKYFRLLKRLYLNFYENELNFVKNNAVLSLL
mgnify:FL=1